MTFFDQITFLNLEYLFYQIYLLPERIIDFLRSINVGDLGNFVIKIFIVIVVIALGFLFFSLIRIKEIKKDLGSRSKFYKKLEPQKPHQDTRWQFILDHISSENPSDLRMAIIEADNMLDDLTLNLRLSGDSLGERLKNAKRDSFRTIGLAWEAHKVRNSIAHEGMNFQISKREASRVVGLYEEVFREFNFI